MAYNPEPLSYRPTADRGSGVREALLTPMEIWRRRRMDEQAKEQAAQIMAQRAQQMSHGSEAHAQQMRHGELDDKLAQTRENRYAEEESRRAQQIALDRKNVDSHEHEQLIYQALYARDPAEREFAQGALVRRFGHDPAEPIFAEPSGQPEGAAPVAEDRTVGGMFLPDDGAGMAAPKPSAADARTSAELDAAEKSIVPKLSGKALPGGRSRIVPTSLEDADRLAPDDPYRRL